MGQEATAGGVCLLISMRASFGAQGLGVRPFRASGSFRSASLSLKMCCLLWTQPRGWMSWLTCWLTPCCLLLRGEHNGAVLRSNPSFFPKNLGSSFRLSYSVGWKSPVQEPPCQLVMWVYFSGLLLVRMWPSLCGLCTLNMKCYGVDTAWGVIYTVASWMMPCLFIWLHFFDMLGFFPGSVLVGAHRTEASLTALTQSHCTWTPLSGHCVTTYPHVSCMTPGRGALTVCWHLL